CTIDDPNYVSKDRHGVTPDYAPFNLREILRSAGYRLSRWPGLEWQDAVADGIAHGILALPPNVESKDVLQKALDYMRQQGYADLYIRWALRDGLDRAILSRARKASVFSGFGII
ncbi:MAG: hypothetical protein Q7R39_01765, partial [Dehalococcoidia bacterium]|nr:hypothetical protein [Dehalococcoidia bacterium]